MQPYVSIITVNYRQTAITCDLLASIHQLSYPSIETIVVDNGALEDATAHFKSCLPSVRVIVSKENLGFAGGNNLGIRQAKGEVVFLINNDTLVGDGLIEHLVERLQQPGVGAVSPKIHYFDEPGVIQYAGFSQVNPLTGRNQAIGQGEQDRGQHDVARKVPYAHGAALMIRRAVLDKVGLMPEVFFLYYEELDWCEQIRRAGFEIWYEPAATILHKESVSTGKSSPLKTEYLTRNRILFMRRNFGGWRLAAFLFFFTMVSLPTGLLRLLASGNTALAKAMLKGYLWHFSSSNAPSKLASSKKTA